MVPEPRSCTFWPPFFAGPSRQIHAAADALLGASGHRRLRVILVHQCDVVVDVLLVLHHPAQPVLNDHRNFVSERWVVRHAIRNCRREQMTMAVLML